MASDASIYGLIRQPEPQPGPLDQYTKAMQLKALMGQSQTQDLQRQQLQQSLTDTQNVRDLFAQNPGGNVPVSQVMQASPSFGMQYQKTQLENQKTRGDIEKTAIDAQAAHVKMMRDSLAAVNDQQSYDMWKTAAGPIFQKAGKAVPDQYDPKWQQQNIMDADKFIQQNTMSLSQRENLKVSQETLRVKKQEADPFGMLGINTNPKGGMGQPNASQSPGVAAGGIQQPQGAGPSGDEFLKTVDPALATQIKAYAEGRMAFPSGFALKSPYFQGMLRAVGQYDPNFDAVNYNARAKTRADATTGTMAKSNNALNTGIGHLEQLSDAVQGLGNVEFSRTANTIKNVFSKEFGGTGVTNFDAVVNRVAPEITKIWRGAGGAEADIQRDIDSLSKSNTPAQLKGAINNIANLMESKLQANANQYKQGMGIAAQNTDFVTPQAKATLNRLRGNSEGGASAGWSIQKVQ